MAEQRWTQIAFYHLLFATLALGIVFLRLLPLNTVPHHLPPPDLLLGLVLAWTIRRPDLLPVWLIALVIFLSDMLLMRPPGLGTILVVVATEALRHRHKKMRATSLLLEIAIVAAIMAAMIAVTWLTQSILFVQQPSLGAQLVQVPMSMAAYPGIVALCHYIIGIRKRPVPEGFGRRLGV